MEAVKTNSIEKNASIVSILKAMQKSYSVHYSKSESFKKLYEKYLRRIFSKKITEMELNEVRDFLHSAGNSIGLESFIEAMRINDAKVILNQRDFILQRLYIIATIPKDDNQLSSFLEKVARIAETKKELWKYLVINHNYDWRTLINDVFHKSYQVYSDLLDIDCNSGRFDDYGSLPDINASLIELLKVKDYNRFSSSIFLTDDLNVSHHIVGQCPNWSDHPNPAVTQILKEQIVDSIPPINCGYGTILVLDFPNKEFYSVKE